MKKGIVLEFTGSRGVEIPLLYFAAKIYEDKGYEKKVIPCKVEEVSDFPQIYGEICSSVSKMNLQEYEDVVFASKSIGTYISCKIKEKLKLKAKLILFTPIEETLEYIKNDNDILLVAAGDKDNWLDTNVLQEKCISENINYYIEPGVGHRMEVMNDIGRNIDVVRNVICRIPTDM